VTSVLLAVSAAPSARVPTLLGFLPLAVLLVLVLEREVLSTRARSAGDKAADRVLLLAAAPLAVAFLLFAVLNIALNLG
jgi:hypothetical protein